MAPPDMTPDPTPGAVWGQTMEAGSLTVGGQELAPSPGPQAQEAVVLQMRLETCDRMIADALERQAAEQQAFREADAKAFDAAKEQANSLGELAQEIEHDQDHQLPDLVASVGAGKGEVSVYPTPELPPDPTIGIIALVAAATELAARLDEALDIAPKVAELKEMVDRVIEVGREALVELARDDRPGQETREADPVMELEAKLPEEQARQEAATREEQQPAQPEQHEAEQAADKQAQEAARQEEARQEAARQEAARQEEARQEAARQEAARQEAARQEAARQEAARQEAARQAASREQER